MTSNFLSISNTFYKLASDYSAITEAFYWKTTWVNITPDDFQFLIFQISQDNELSQFGARCLDRLASWADTSRQSLFAFVFDLKNFIPNNELEQEIKQFLSRLKKYIIDVKSIKTNYPDVFAALRAMMDYVKFCSLYELNQNIPISLYANIVFAPPNQIAKNLHRHLNGELSENGSYVAYRFYFDELKKEVDKMILNEDGLLEAEKEVKNCLNFLFSSLRFEYEDKNFNNFREWIIGVLEQTEWKITAKELHALISEEFDLPSNFSVPGLDRFFEYLNVYQHLTSFQENVGKAKNDFIKIILNLNGRLMDVNNLNLIFSKYSAGFKIDQNAVIQYMVACVIGTEIPHFLKMCQMYRDKIKHKQNNPLTRAKTVKDGNLLDAKKMIDGGNFNRLCVMLINSNP
jgi:hypothetical protein